MITQERLRELGLENAKVVAVIRGIDVPRALGIDLWIPALRGKNLDEIAALAANGREQGILPTAAPERFTIRFKEIDPASKTDLSFYDKSEAAASSPPVDKPPDKPAPKAAPPQKGKEFWSKTKSVINTANPLKVIQDKHMARLTEKRARIAAIRGKDISMPNLKDKRVLTFDHAGCWARALGMIQITAQLTHELKRPLHEYYDRITGQGDGAIIAAAVAAGISLDDLGRWWTGDWRKAHTPGKIAGAGRWLASKVLSNQSGFSARKASKALKKLFRGLTMADARTELHITVMQGDLNSSIHRSEEHAGLMLWEACEDTAVTRMDYNQKQTVKGEAVFLGAVEKNDVLNLVSSPENEGLEVTSIGTPVRVDPDEGQKLAGLGAEADKKALRKAGHFVYNKRVGQVIQKLTAAGYKIRYFRLECAAVDGVVANSTTNRAMELGKASGDGQINPPEWFAAGLDKTA